MTSHPEHEGVLTAYGNALGDLIVMAMVPLCESEPRAAKAIWDAFQSGAIDLVLHTRLAADENGSLQLCSIDTHGTSATLATLTLGGVRLN